MSTKQTVVRADLLSLSQQPNVVHIASQGGSVALRSNNTEHCQAPEEVKLQFLNDAIQELREELTELEELEDVTAAWDIYERPRLKHEIILFEDERTTLVNDHNRAALKRLREELKAPSHSREDITSLTHSCPRCVLQKMRAKRHRHPSKKHPRKGLLDSLIQIGQILRFCKFSFH